MYEIKVTKTANGANGIAKCVVTYNTHRRVLADAIIQVNTDGSYNQTDLARFKDRMETSFKVRFA